MTKNELEAAFRSEMERLHRGVHPPIVADLHRFKRTLDWLSELNFWLLSKEPDVLDLMYETFAKELDDNGDNHRWAFEQALTKCDLLKRRDG